MPNRYRVVLNPGDTQERTAQAGDIPLDGDGNPLGGAAMHKNANGAVAYTYTAGGQVATATETNSDGTTINVKTYTYNASGQIVTIASAQYGSDGVLDETVTMTITYNANGTVASTANVRS